MERVKVCANSILESGQPVLPVVELKAKKLTVKELKLSPLEWEQRMETIQNNGPQRKVLVYKFPVNTVSTHATSDRTYREWSKFINHFKPQGNIKDLSYSIIPESERRKKHPLPHNIEYVVTPELTVVPPRLTDEEKAERLLTETKATEDSFLKGAMQLLKRVSRLKADEPDDQFIQSFYAHLKKGIKEIQPFNNRIAESLAEATLADKIKSLDEAYSSDEFSKYGESIISLTVMHQELLQLIATKKHPYTKIIDRTQSSSDPIIFGQRLPRHLLLIKEINKLKVGGEGISEQRVVKAAEKMNTGLLFKTMFSGPEKAFNEGVGKAHTSFSAFVSALEDQAVYFAGKSEKRV